MSRYVTEIRIRQFDYAGDRDIEKVLVAASGQASDDGAGRGGAVGMSARDRSLQDAVGALRAALDKMDGREHP